MGNNGWELPTVDGRYFHPTEFELIEGFLMKKIIRKPLPNDIIKEIPFLYDYPPELLPIWTFNRGRENEAYYFTHKGKKPPNGELFGRKKFNGQWRTDGHDEAVRADNKILGFLRKLYFYRGRGAKREEDRLGDKGVQIQSKEIS